MKYFSLISCEAYLNSNSKLISIFNKYTCIAFLKFVINLFYVIVIKIKKIEYAQENKN